MNLSVPTENFVTRFVNLTFSVLEPPSTPAMIKDFWSSYGTLVSLIAAGFLPTSLIMLGAGRRMVRLMIRRVLAYTDADFVSCRLIEQQNQS